VREDFASRFAKRLGASLANQISIGGLRLQ
jgi:hypothetical protein